MCVVITGLLPLLAEANDTRNRVLTHTISLPYQFSYNRTLDLDTNVETNCPENTYNNNFVFTMQTYVDGIEIISPQIFARYYPGTTGNPYYNKVPLSIAGAPRSLGKPLISIYNNEIKLYEETITVGGLNYVYKVSFSGRASGITDFYGIYTPFNPNTAYWIYMGGILSDHNKYIDKGGGRNFGYGIFYDNATAKVTGYGVLDSTCVPANITSTSFNNSIMFYMPADDPSITISNVTTDTATISWDTNNTNPEGTSYTLQYQQLKENGNPSNEADWESWTTIPIEGCNTTTLKTTTQSIFSQNNTYRLRVQVNHIGGSDYNVYSDYVIFSTDTDPAVRAAYEAAIAAQAAKKAAEDTVQYSLDAKNEATGAKNKAQEVYDLVSSLELGGVKEDVSFIKNTMSTPVIQSVKGQNNATATHNDNFVLNIRAAGIQDNLRYRVVCDGFDSGWGTSNTILITGLNTTGIKTAQVYVSNYPDDPDKGSIAMEEFMFFKL